MNDCPEINYFNECPYMVLKECLLIKYRVVVLESIALLSLKDNFQWILLVVGINVYWLFKMSQWQVI